MALRKFLLLHFDLPVRILYSRIPFVRDLLHFISRQRYETDLAYSRQVYQSLVGIFSACQIGPRFPSVLEIGPGDHCFLGCLFLSNNVAEDYFLVDKYPRFGSLEKDISSFKEVAGYQVNPSRLRLFRDEANSLSFLEGESVDLLLSVSVWEHLENLPLVLQKAYRVLKPGAYLYASVDLRDHYNFDSPLLFLKYRQSLYQTLLSCPGYSYTNRLRADDYERIIASTSFQVIMFKKYFFDLKDEWLRTVQPEFLAKGREILAVSRLEILLRKPEA